MIIAPLLLALVTLLGPAAEPGALDGAWTRFRGPNGTGVADSRAPSRFGPGLHVVWRAETPAGHSSPVIGERQIYLTAFENDTLWTIALDRDSGEERWRRPAPRSREQKLDPRNHPAAASPVTDGGRVYVFFGDFGLLGYAEDGEELWRLPLGPFDNLYGVGASPILVEDLLVLAVDQQTGSYLLAVDAVSGAERWRALRPGATSGHSTPVVHRPQGGSPQLLLPGSFRLTAYSLAGDELWWVDGLSFEMKSTPAIAGGLLFINGYGSPLNEPGEWVDPGDFADALEAHDGNADGGLSAAELPEGHARSWLSFTDLDGDGALRADEWSYFRAALRSRNSMIAIRLPESSARGDLSESHVAWRYHQKIPQLPSPVVYRDVLYMINDRGIVTSFEAANGSVIAQGRIEGAVDSYYASPVAADGKIFFAGRSGKVAVLGAGGGLAPLAVNDLDETIYASPALANDRLYVRTASALYAFAAPGG